MPILRSPKECKKLINQYHAACSDVYERKVTCTNKNLRIMPYNDLIKYQSKLKYKVLKLKNCYIGRILYRDECLNQGDDSHEEPIRRAFRYYNGCLKEQMRVNERITEYYPETRNNIPTTEEGWIDVKSNHRKNIT